MCMFERIPNQKQYVRRYLFSHITRLTDDFVPLPATMADLCGLQEPCQWLDR